MGCKGIVCVSSVASASVVAGQVDLRVGLDLRTHRRGSQVGGRQMIGYVHLQVDIRDLLILYVDLRNLQRGVELRVVECSRSLCLDSHHSLGVDLLRLQSLQLIEANARKP